MGHLKVMAGIGGVCVQWALLEHLALGLIAGIEGNALDKIYLMFGSLDMKPRLDMAINLATAAKVPTSLVQHIRAVRTALRDERLSDRRNQAIHGAHKASDEPDSIQLTMPRWGEPRRTETVSVIDLYNLSRRLHSLGSEIDAIATEVHEWKMRVLNNRLEHSKRQAAEAGTSLLVKIAKNLNARRQNFWRKLNR